MYHIIMDQKGLNDEFKPLSSDLAKYVSSETSRVSKLMTTKNVDSKKKKEFQLKLNILASFK